MLQIYRRLPLRDGGNQRVLAVLWYLREGQRWHEEAAGGLSADAARRAVIDGERARTPRDADTAPDDGDTGEVWVGAG
jgi:hypothetical protein